MDNRPIGVFDSGFGGVSVLAAALNMLPKERFIYLGDNLHAPYGSLSEETIMAYTKKSVRFVIDSGCKAIVIACNTITSVAASALRKELALPIIAMEPALKPASMIAGDGQVLVIATEITLKLAKFKRLMENFGQGAIPIPCPKLVSAIEAGMTEGEEIRTLLKEYLSAYLNEPVKAVVLGCTHFVFLKKALRAFLPKNTLLIDGNEGTVRQLEKRLTQESLLSGAEAMPASARVVFYSTKQDAQTLARMQTMLDIALNQL